MTTNDDERRRRPTVDTVVHTYQPIDLGAGPQMAARFPDSKAKTDDAGHLVIFTNGEAGSVIFNRDVWALAVTGEVTVNDDGGFVLVRRGR
jgi:hypothetical protein